MTRMIWPLLAALALAGCGGGGEDFTLTVKRPVVVAYTPFGNVDLPPEMRALFPGLKLDRTRPSDSEVIYTIPGSGDELTRIRLVFEASEAGKATVVHASVDVPAIRAVIGGQQKVISERLVEAELQAVLKGAVSQLEAGSDAAGARTKFASLLGALAVATDKNAMARAQDMMKDPARYAAQLGTLDRDLFENYDAENDAETTDDPRGDRAQPGSDPDAALEREDYARDHRENVQERKLDAASAAGDAGQGDTPEPTSEADAE